MGTQETWFSIDVEASGPVPGIYDMVSIGATVIAQNESKRQELAHSRPTFYAEFRPHGGAVDPEATAVHGLTPEHLQANGGDPKEIIETFLTWVKVVANTTRPVAASWGTFDWMWVGYYLEKYGKRYTYPFGPNSMDLKSYYLGLTRGTEWRKSQKRHMPAGDLVGVHTHNAMDDAVEQAQMVESWLKKYAER